MNLFEVGKEYELRKTIRILVYPNITFLKDLEKDSYIQVIKKQIKLLNEIRDDLWFYLILPKPVPSLTFPNVTQYYTNFETHPPTMRVNFTVQEIKKIVHSGLDFDLVMSHLPEHTHQLTATLSNLTHHVPFVFGYCHWWDFKVVTTWPGDSFRQNIIGLLKYDRCYLNTQYQKNMVLEESKEIFNDRTIKQLDEILTVQHLGVDENDIADVINETPEKIIVFNHRPETYKHFNQFISLTDTLYKKRQDFKVWVPLLDKPNRDYVITDKGDKTFYYNMLKKCCVGFSPKQTYGGWSVATTDGLMNGCPYIMYDDLYYRELNSDADFFKSNDEAIVLLEKYLDDSNYRNEKSKSGLETIKNKLIYKNEMIKMSDYIDDIVKNLKIMGNTEKLFDIVEYIRKNKTVTKQDMVNYLGWGRGIKWSPYRRAILKHPNIFDTMSEYPNYVWKE